MKREIIMKKQVYERRVYMHMHATCTVFIHWPLCRHRNSAWCLGWVGEMNLVKKKYAKFLKGEKIKIVAASRCEFHLAGSFWFIL